MNINYYGKIKKNFILLITKFLFYSLQMRIKPRNGTNQKN